MDENIMESDIFTLTDEDGNEIEFELIAQCERNGNKYFAMIPVSDEEKEYRRLWKNYFDNIAIRERTNPRCQRNFMPVRYWKHLTEMTEI